MIKVILKFHVEGNPRGIQFSIFFFEIKFVTNATKRLEFYKETVVNIYIIS